LKENGAMSEQLDLLLINPGDRASSYQRLGASLAAIEPPIWTGLLASFVRGKGYSVEVLDANAEGLGPRETAERVCGMSPRLAAVIVYGHNPSASTQNMPAAGALCRQAKELAPDLPLLLLGGHVAALPEQTLREEAADFVCGGEGPYTLTDLLSALREPNPDLSKVRGLLYRDGQRVVANPAAPLVEDLDGEMPGLAWDLLPMHLYRAHNWHCYGDLHRQPYGAIYTTLGCPFHCSFCCIQAPFRSGEQLLGRKKLKSYRLWSPDAVLRQIGLLVERHGVRHIKFADEMFVYNKSHVRTICEGIIAHGWDVNIWAYARVDTIQDEMLPLLKKAGFNWLAFGIEAGSDKVRDGVSKGINRQGILNAMQRVRDAGIYIGANYIFGLPDDDLGSMQETLDLAMEIRSEFANFYCAMAYPGSNLYSHAVSKGWPLPSSWEGFAQFSRKTQPLPTNHLSAAEVLRFRDRAFQLYHRDPGYLQHMEKLFGPDTVKHIREMTSEPITRDLLA
jgi:radical SAM superfamily enzyme YgiQ (UPF0313 family)